MANGGEGVPGGVDQESIFIEELKERVRQVNDSLSFLARLEQIEADASEAERNVNERAKDREEGRDTRSLEMPRDGKVGDKVSLRHKLVVTDITTKEALMKLKQNEALIPAPAGSTGETIIKKLISKFDNPASEIGSNSAPYVYKILSAAARGRISNPLDILSSEELKHLKTADSTLAKKVINSLTESAQEIGLGQDRIDRFKSEIKKIEQIRDEDGDIDMREFANDFGNLFRQFFREPKEIRILKAIYSPSEFEGYRNEITEEIQQERHNQNKPALSQAELARVSSEKIETDIVLLFSKLYQNVDLQSPDRFFDEITQEGFMQSINVAYETLSRRLTQLINKAAVSGEVPDSLSGDIFYKRFTEEELEPRTEEQADKTTKEVMQYKLIPTPNARTVNLREFLEMVKTQSGVMVDARKYLHNVRALFRRGAGKEGFWSQLSEYAQTYPSVDNDSLSILPDGDIVMAANRLYTKYLEEDMAALSWIHRPNMFDADIFENLTRIEQRVLEDLKKMFPDIAASGENDWRLRSALSMGIGFSRGVNMTEVEIAAWADPNVTTIKGEPTYTSYYTNDNVALTALNPAHHILRWQQEGITKGPLAYLLVDGFDPSLERFWDHNRLYDRMKQFKDSYLNGLDAIKRNNPEEKLFVEMLPNIGKVGSLITRGGWRKEYAYDGWLIKDQGKVKILGSFKALENIGYEVAAHFIDKYVSDNKFLATPSPERDEVLQYIYEKYIKDSTNPGETGTTLDEYYNLLRSDASNAIDLLIKSGKINKNQRAHLIDQEIMRRVFYRGLVGMLKQRIPTKFIRIERDRLTKDGESGWKKLKKQLQWGTPRKMEEAMDNIALVETVVRQKVSEQMRSRLREQGRKQDLAIISVDYVVNEDVIKEVLTEMGIDATDAVALYKQIDSYLNENYIKEFSEKIRTKDAAGEAKESEFPFALGTEELDSSFVAWRNVGPSILKRALGDTGKVETEVVGQMQSYFDLLQKVAVDPNRDISKMVEILKHMSDNLAMIHGPAEAAKFAYRMSAMTIAYFKKDTLARNIFTKWFRIGKKNSLAAEFTGAYRGVWEWEVSDIDSFITELERNLVLRKEPIELSKIPKFKDVKFLGIKIGRKPIHEPNFQYYGKTLREKFGATKKHIALELMNKYLPILLIFLILQSIRKAGKEEFGSGRN